MKLRLRYQPPYDWESMLAYLGARAIPGIEVVDGDRYLRTVAMDGSTGSIEVLHLPERESIGLTICFPEARTLAAIVSRVRRLFDLDADTGAIGRHLARDPVLAPLVARRPGLRAPGAWDGFELAIRAILGQQISVRAARGLAGQLVALHGLPVSARYATQGGLTHVFPTAERLACAESIGLGMPAARIKSLQALAEASAADPSLFHSQENSAEAIARLRSIRGVGEWTAQYIALRALREMDAFPASDIVLLRSMARMEGERLNPASLLARAESWRPWRAYAAQYLWTAEGRALITHEPYISAK